MLEKHINTLHLAIQGIIFIILGIIVIISKSILMLNIIHVFGILFLLTAIFSFLDWILHLKKIDRLFYAIFQFCLALFVFLYPHIPMAILPLLYSIVLFLHMTAHLITTYLFWRNHLKDRIREGCLAFIYFILFSIMFLEPLVHLDFLLQVIGIYMIGYGLINIKDALLEEMNISTKNRIKRKVRLPLPIIFAAIIPHRVLSFINHYFEENGDSFQPEIRENKGETKPDIEVLIHVTEDGYGAFGHVDICYHGYVISYGNYDAATYHLFDTIGEGVLFIAPKEKYIPFCKEDSQKTLFGFGLTLTKEQKVAVNRRFNEFFKNLEVWKPDYQLAQEKNDSTQMEASLAFYANRLYKTTKAKMYKFKSGPFKTYFVLSTNCVAMADTIVGKTGIDIIGINGVITPGTYYEYFNQEFLKSNSKVVTRTIYR